jgi:hypothetical protein
MSALPTKQIEFMLAGWDESHCGGKKVTFWVADDDEFSYFKNATVRKGKVAGQRYAAVLVQLTDDEQPDPESVKPLPAKGAGIVAPKSRKASTTTATSAPAEPATEAATPGPETHESPKRKGHGHFPLGLCGLAVKWCDDEHFQEWCAFTFTDQWAECADSPAKAAAYVVKRVCEVSSRKELDTDPTAGGNFRSRIVVPYVACRKADGLDT